MVISVNPPRSSSILLDGKDVLRQTHSPRALSKSIEARYSSVSYLNTGNGLSGGHLPARINFISACCTGDVSPALFGLARSCSFNFMIRPEQFSSPHDFSGVRPANFEKWSSRRGFERTVRVVTQVQHFFAGQRDFLETGVVALRAGHVHLVTPCSPTSVWEEPFSLVRCRNFPEHSES